eukprot:GHVU01112463.1.p3 GENE.GHVU01112463.1~~GHVU01112463.1.p3  ORF type:complete len:129 (+),score=9.79 GHVU01112463.1:514-900(+)
MNEGWIEAVRTREHGAVDGCGSTHAHVLTREQTHAHTRTHACMHVSTSAHMLEDTDTDTPAQRERESETRAQSVRILHLCVCMYICMHVSVCVWGGTCVPLCRQNPEMEALRLRVLELEDRLQQTKGR